MSDLDRILDCASDGSPFLDPGYFHTDVDTGVMQTRSGHRMIALTDDFLAGFRDGLVEECGPAAAEVLKTCGATFGEMMARRFEAELSDHFQRPVRDLPMAVFDAALADLLAACGWGEVRVEYDRYDRGLLVARCRNPIFARILGSAEEPVESLLAGFLQGFFGAWFDEALECEQLSCVACGADESVFVLTLKARLGDVPGWRSEKVPAAEMLERLAGVRVTH